MREQHLIDMAMDVESEKNCHVKSQKANWFARQKIIFKSYFITT
jgi:hypothetical protein